MATPSRLPSTRRPPGAAAGRSRPTSMIEPGFSGLPTPTKADSQKSKRLSLLPQFPRSISAEHKKEDVIEREIRDPEIPQRDGSHDIAVNAAQQADRRAMPPPPISRLTRGPSTRVPASSQIGRAPSTRSHSRTQSIQSNTAAARSEPQNNAAASPFNARLATAGGGHMRAPSAASASQTSRISGLARSTSVRTSQPQSHSRNSSITATVPTSGIRRTNSVRPTSINTSIASQVPPPQSPTSPRRALDLKSSSRPQLPPSSKPTFSTFQQHYSPAKTALPKPPVPTSKLSRPAPAVEEDLSVPFDVAKQQIELLQLSLLHEASAQTTRQYTADAKRKLGRRHARLRKDFEAVRAAELAQQKLANMKALQAWCPDPTLLAENLQALARVHKDVNAITHPESRYTELLRVFKDWAALAETKMAETTKGFVEPLPGSWREAHASTALKIRSLQREMAPLPPLPEQDPLNGVETSLEMILGSCRSLVDGILRELDMMAKLEKELLGQEKARIDGAIGALRLDGHREQVWTSAWLKKV